MTQDEAVAARALERGFVTAAQLEQARARLVMLRRAGLPTDLLAVLAPALQPAQLAELRAAGPVADEETLAPGGVIPAPPPAPPPARALPAGAPRPGGRVGPYVLARELGRGGMGVVYAAEHADLRRVVALKLKLSAPGGDRRSEQRFLAEARAAGRLRHPAIVAVHDAGRDERGQLWIAMDFVEGESLDARVARDGPLPPREVAGIGVTVARALQHAHGRGVLHRDLKPANVLLRRDGAALVTDFGLAKVVEGAESLTRTGEVLGTPSFMPPEQACGRDVGARADVYSLGATLYHLLLGRPPFAGDGLIATLAAVMRGSVDRPRDVRPEVPAALEAVILRCLAKDPAERYGDAASVADDLQRFLADEQTEAATLAGTRRRARALLLLALLLGAAGLAAGLAVAGQALLRTPDVAAVAPATERPAPPTPEASPASEAGPLPPAVEEEVLPPPRPGSEYLTGGAALWMPMREGPGVRPPARWGHALTYDPRRKVVVLLGGWNGAASLDDQWAWDGVSWKEETPRQRPEARYAHGLAYDEVRGRLVLVGGAEKKVDDRAAFETVWEFDGERWTPCTLGPGPGKRGWHGLTWDPAGRRVILFGGADDAWKLHADVWGWDGARWTPLAPGAGPAPAPRHQVAIAWDPRRGVLVVYGAYDGEGHMDEHWEWHPERGWALLAADAKPGSRMLPSLVDTGRELVLFGGVDTTGRETSTLWTWDGQAWTHRLEHTTEGLLPPRRRWQAMAYHRGRDTLALFGGRAPSGKGLQETWTLRPEW